MKTPNIFGLAGVAPNENPRARRCAEQFEWPMMLLALWIIVEWYLTATGRLEDEAVTLSDWLIWAIFLTETLTLTFLVDNKIQYLKKNWINLLIIVTAFPPTWGSAQPQVVFLFLRLLIALSMVFHISARARRLLSKNQLGSTLVAATILVIASGFIVAGLDPAVKSPLDGIWWAWVTITTVGYGDIAPTTVEGRLFGSVLILVGIGIISLITASFSAFFVAEDKEEQRKNDREILAQMKAMNDRLQAIEKKLDERKEPPA